MKKILSLLACAALILAMTGCDSKKTEKTTSDKTYSVQVGAYKEKKNAEDMKRKLKKAGFDGAIKEV